MGRRTRSILKKQSSLREKLGQTEECLEPTETSMSTMGEGLIQEQSPQAERPLEENGRTRNFLAGRAHQRRRRASLSNFVAALHHTQQENNNHHAIAMFQEKCNELLSETDQVIQELKRDIVEIQHSISNKLSAERSSAAAFLATRQQVPKLERERTRVMKALDYLQLLRIDLLVQKDEARENFHRTKKLDFESLPLLDDIADQVRNILKSDSSAPPSLPRAVRQVEDMRVSMPASRNSCPSLEQALLSSAQMKDGWCLDNSSASRARRRRLSLDNRSGRLVRSASQRGCTAPTA